MAAIGDGYGSECHLLRYLGRHRQRLNEAVLKATGAKRVAWLDVPFDTENKWKDGAWTGFDFLPEKDRARRDWKNTWPRNGPAVSWDAIGLAETKDGPEWLLVEAKAHIDELRSDCPTGNGGGLTTIRETLAEVKSDLDVNEVRDWLHGYYHHCARVAALWFLLSRKTPAQMLSIYFTGDQFPMPAFVCPEDETGWLPALQELRKHVALPIDHGLTGRLHEIFLPVVGALPARSLRRSA